MLRLSTGVLQGGVQRRLHVDAQPEVRLDIVPDFMRDDWSVGQVLDLRPREVDQGDRQAPQRFADRIAMRQRIGGPQLRAAGAGDGADLVGERD